MESRSENTIGENIRRLREERGWTQAELGAMCGLGTKHISALERGASKPGPKVMPKLCDAFAVDELTIRFGERGAPTSIDPDLESLQNEVARVFELVKADSPLKKHEFMTKLWKDLKALGEEGQDR